MAMRLSGIWFKLVEPDGFYAGILMVPEVIAQGVENGRARYCPLQGLPSVRAPNWAVIPQDMFSYIDFVPCDHILRGAIAVFGISLSDLNKERGFAFIPSFDYLQRGYVPPKVVTPDRKYGARELDLA